MSWMRQGGEKVGATCVEAQRWEAVISGHCQSRGLAGVWGVTEDKPREVARDQIVKGLVPHVRRLGFI